MRSPASIAVQAAQYLLAALLIGAPTALLACDNTVHCVGQSVSCIQDIEG